LHKPKHNTLKYNVVPKGHLALWGAYDGSNDHWLTHTQLSFLAHDLCCDVVPLVGWASERKWGLDEIDKALDRESFLGGAKIEGLVFKNYEHDLLIGDQYVPFLAAKFVSEKFKEQHVKNCKPGGNKIQEFMDSFCTEARWLKAIQSTRDEGVLKMEPSDIGPILRYMSQDLEEECKEDIEAWLYKHFIGNIRKSMNRGFPEFYKRWLVEQV